MQEGLQDTVTAYEMQNKFLNKEVLELNQLRQQGRATGLLKEYFLLALEETRASLVSPGLESEISPDKY